MTAKRLPDGRRFLSWAEADEIPESCPDCGRSWSDHEGQAELAAVDGHAGWALPNCPQQ